MKKSKQLHAGTIQAYDAKTDKYSVLFQNGNTVEWELEQVCKTSGASRSIKLFDEVLNCLMLLFW